MILKTKHAEIIKLLYQPSNE